MKEFYGERCSGRTTRMLETASQALRDGGTVALVAANRAHLSSLLDQLARIRESDSTPRVYGFVVGDTCWDIKHPLEIRGLEYAKVFVDHYAVDAYI